MNLVATALGWGSVNLGGFLDEALTQTLRLDGDLEAPIYATALGKPMPLDTSRLREP